MERSDGATDSPFRKKEQINKCNTLATAPHEMSGNVFVELIFPPSSPVYVCMYVCLSVSVSFDFVSFHLAFGLAVAVVD